MRAWLEDVLQEKAELEGQLRGLQVPAHACTCPVQGEHAA
jgi:hypothetical protein